MVPVRSFVRSQNYSRPFSQERAVCLCVYFCARKLSSNEIRCCQQQKTPLWQQRSGELQIVRCDISCFEPNPTTERKFQFWTLALLFAHTVNRSHLELKGFERAAFDLVEVFVVLEPGVFTSCQANMGMQGWKDIHEVAMNFIQKWGLEQVNICFWISQMWALHCLIKKRNCLFLVLLFPMLLHCETCFGKKTHERGLFLRGFLLLKNKVKGS